MTEHDHDGVTYHRLLIEERCWLTGHVRGGAKELDTLAKTGSILLISSRSKSRRVFALMSHVIKIMTP